VRLIAIRTLMLGTLVGLYVVNSIVGVAALAGGFGYVVWQRLRFARCPAEPRS
jgi:nitrate reductase NapE component